MTVKYRHRLSTQITLLGLAVAVVMALTFVYVIPYVDLRLYEENKSEVRRSVELAAAALANVVDLSGRGGLDSVAVEQRVKETIVRLSAAGDEYFWLQDSQGVMLAHPIKPELDGRSQWDFQDPGGKYIFRDFAKTAAAGGGFVDYLWPKPGKDKPVEKVSYVTKVPGRDWIIGSGIYLDDVERTIGQMTFSLAAMAGVKLIVVMAACLLLGRSYTKPVRAVLGLAQQMAEGDLSGQALEEKRRDELGAMTKELNRMRRSLRDDVRMVVAAAHLAGLAAGEISQGNLDLSRRVQERAAMSEELAAAITQLSAVVKINSEITAGANQAAAQLAEQLKADDRAGGEEWAEQVWSLAQSLSDAAANSWEQAVTLGQLEQAVAGMDAAIQEDAALVEEVAVAAANLDDEAKSLVEQMQRFKLV